MFVPHSFALALLMMITSAVCWGSWANTYKGVKNYRFELFYWDYAFGIFLISLILGPIATLLIVVLDREKGG